MLSTDKEREIRRLVAKYTPEYRVRIVKHNKMPNEKREIKYRKSLNRYISKRPRILQLKQFRDILENADEITRVLDERKDMAWGSISLTKKTIYINREVLKTDNWKDVILHEIAHALTPNDTNHGNKWKLAYEKLVENEED